LSLIRVTNSTKEREEGGKKPKEASKVPGPILRGQRVGGWGGGGWGGGG